MWIKGWRNRIWTSLDSKWDLIVIGGGITGAGILHESTRAGMKTLLVEAQDFASGSSSRSSKLVHGGFRYLRNGLFRLTYESVRERERLLKEAKGLITQMGFLMPSYSRDRLPPWIFGLGLSVYSLLALKWNHRFYDQYDIQELCPLLNDEGLRGGYRFFDAQTDDARLVLRVIRECVSEGAVALNYAKVTHLLRDNSGNVCGIVLTDQAQPYQGRTVEVQAPIIINATGAWADELRSKIGREPRLRKLRGSHIIFHHERLPLSRAISFFHPQDYRPVFAFPWEGITLVGTTDVEHGPTVSTDIAISNAEVGYLLRAVQMIFPCQELTRADILATFSGIRSVVNRGKADPSKESREHVLWHENGLQTVTGGKLTTFRIMAKKALIAISMKFQPEINLDPDARVLSLPPTEEVIHADISRASRIRILGRYAADAPLLIEAAENDELTIIPGTTTLWAELRWAARAEGVVHLDDLLLRRVRLGLLQPKGGIVMIDRIRCIVQKELDWDDTRWQAELNRYTEIWNRFYSPPE